MNHGLPGTCEPEKYGNQKILYLNSDFLPKFCGPYSDQKRMNFIKIKFLFKYTFGHTFQKASPKLD